MTVTITYKTNDGRNHRYKLNGTEKLSSISRKKEAIFVIGMTVYNGYSDGKIDECGNFSIWDKPENPSKGIGVPANKLVGWAYKRNRKEVKDEEK